MKKANFELKIDYSINRFYDRISDNLEIVPEIPKDKALLILNQLLSYVCDASNRNLIDYSNYLIKKIPSEWIRDNVQKAVELNSNDAWKLDLTDPYVFDNLIYFLNQIGCYTYIKKITNQK
ncbi:MAG: hypothetical protein K2G36_00410 [Ruminococcus sp.]|nr:hypothetical protein [Ruminococcus sp.]